MSNKSNKRKFQPRITFNNTLKLSCIHQSIAHLASFKSIEDLEAISETNPELEIFYFVHDDSSKGLKPIRDEARRFLTVLILKDC